ncbi:MAG: nitroreductase family deazaflavin-dependent oxidoreductase [Acidimicrobiia bacterium]
MPWFVRVVDPLARRLLRLGIPMGPNTLLTVRGRRSGQPRTAAVAIVEVDSRRWVIGSYGNVNWVRNLRAAGEGTIRTGRRSEQIVAVELSAEEAAAFFRDVLAPYVEGLPWIGRIWVPQEILEDPVSAASSRPVFQLHAQPG